MNIEGAKSRVKELSSLLHQYNHLYYVKNESVVSDYEFDLLLKDLEALENQFPSLQDENSPTKRVGGDITKNSKRFSTDIQCFPYQILIPKKKLLNGKNASKKPLKAISNMFANLNMMV